MTKKLSVEKVNLSNIMQGAVELPDLIGQNREALEQDFPGLADRHVTFKRSILSLLLAWRNNDVEAYLIKDSFYYKGMGTVILNRTVALKGAEDSQTKGANVAYWLAEEDDERRFGVAEMILQRAEETAAGIGSKVFALLRTDGTDQSRELSMLMKAEYPAGIFVDLSDDDQAVVDDARRMLFVN
jgi:GNAT superfamily N-acetyltransferase